MKAPLDVEVDRKASVAEVELAMRIQALFAACPNLCGFVIEGLGGLHGDAHPRDVEDRLVITEVSLRAPLGADESLQVCALIASVIADLVDAQPEAYALLRGRTFARTLH